MNKRLVALAIMASTVLLLTSCGHSPTKPSTKTSPSSVPSSSSLSLGTLDSGLILPAMKNPFPVAQAGTAVDKWGKDYVNSAFRFSFALAYRGQQMTQLWEPNTKKNPQYLVYAKQTLSSFGTYLTPELNQSFQAVIPDLVNPTIENGAKLNKNAYAWSALILVPWRNPDGTLPNPKKGDVANYNLMPPWMFQVSVGEPIATIDTLAPYGQVLKLRYRFTLQQPYGDGVNVKDIVVSNKDMTYWVIPNPDPKTAPIYPWLLASWAYTTTGTVSMVPYDSTAMGIVPPAIGKINFP